MKKTPIAEQFAGYVAALYPDAHLMPPEQFVQIRRAFYSGAKAFTKIFEGDATPQGSVEESILPGHCFN